MPVESSKTCINTLERLDPQITKQPIQAGFLAIVKKLDIKFDTPL